MSQLKVDDIVDSAGTGAPTFSNGAQIFVPKATGANADTALTTTDSRLQVISSCTAVRTYTLPGVGVKAGDRWTFVCNATAANGAYVLIDAADSSVVGVCHTGGNVTEVMALSNDPATASDWLVLRMKEYVSNSTWDADNTGSNTVQGPLGSAIGGALTADLTANSRDVRCNWLKSMTGQDRGFLEINYAGAGWVDSNIRQGATAYPLTLQTPSTAASNRAGIGMALDTAAYADLRFHIKSNYLAGVANSWPPSSNGYKWRVVKVTG